MPHFNIKVQIAKLKILRLHLLFKIKKMTKSKIQNPKINQDHKIQDTVIVFKLKNRFIRFRRKMLI